VRIHRIETHPETSFRYTSAGVIGSDGSVYRCNR